MGGSMDMRGGQSKKSDQAGQDIAAMGKSELQKKPVYLGIQC